MYEHRIRLSTIKETEKMGSFTSEGGQLVELDYEI
jgi:hypothetical protein